MSDQPTIYDKRAGEPKEWWFDLANSMIARPDLNYRELASRVDKSRDVVRWTMKSAKFQALLKGERDRLGKLPAIREAASAMKEGLKFDYSKGQLVNLSRTFLGDALKNNNTIKAKRMVKNAEGKEVEETYDTGVPEVPFTEKRIIALKLIEVLEGKGATIIGKQTNIDKSTHVAIGNLDNLSPALRELADLVVNAVTMKPIKGEDGAVTYVVDESESEGGES